MPNAQLEGEGGSADTDKDGQEGSQTGDELDQCCRGLPGGLTKTGKVGFREAFKNIEPGRFRHKADKELVDLQPHGLDGIADRIESVGIVFEHVAQLADLFGGGSKRRRVTHEGQHFHSGATEELDGSRSPVGWVFDGCDDPGEFAELVLQRHSAQCQRVDPELLKHASGSDAILVDSGQGALKSGDHRTGRISSHACVGQCLTQDN